jgi:hypothetical protein
MIGTIFNNGFWIACLLNTVIVYVTEQGYYKLE